MPIENTCNYRPGFFGDATIRQAADWLNALKAAGIETIIDLILLGLGRG